MQSEQCPAPNHPEEPTAWCGCKHPDFWQWSEAAGGWLPAPDWVSADRVAGAQRRWARVRVQKEAA